MATLPSTLAALLLLASTATAGDLGHPGYPAGESGAGSYSAQVKVRVDAGAFEAEGFPQSTIDAVTDCTNKKLDTMQQFNDCTKKYYQDRNKGL